MLKVTFSFYLVIVSLFAYSQQTILVFSKTTGFRHKSIEKGVETLQKIAKENNFAMRHSEDAALFNPDSLSRYDAVIFLNTTGDLFDSFQKNSLQEFIRSGKGYVGIHAATDTEFNWPWYGALVGAYFTRHPAVQEATIQVVDQAHQATQHLPKTWVLKDEWYEFKTIHPDLQILMTLDESTYTGGQMGAFHPLSWCHEFEGGRAFYTGLGHEIAVYDNADFQQHILGGIQYVLRK